MSLDFERGDECNRVNLGGVTRLLGDAKVKREKPYTIVTFPGGSAGRYCDAGNAALRGEIEAGGVNHIAFLVATGKGAAA